MVQMDCIKSSKKRRNFTIRPNTISISQLTEDVNRKMDKMTETIDLQKEKLYDLYNIPCCFF